MKMLIGWTRTAIALALSLSLAAGVAFAQAGPITVILVRHAEKAATPAADPPLTAAGEARARDLLDAVRDAGVGAVITTQFARTRLTAQPTAAALGLSPEVVPSTGAAHVQDVAAAIRRHVGQTVLVVGHSNTVDAIVEALGAKRPAPICDVEYDNIYTVMIAADGKAGVVHTKYGARTPADASCASMR